MMNVDEDRELRASGLFQSKDIYLLRADALSFTTIELLDKIRTPVGQLSLDICCFSFIH